MIDDVDLAGDAYVTFTAPFYGERDPLRSPEECTLPDGEDIGPDDVRGIVEHHRRTIASYGGTAEAALRSVDRLEARWEPDLFDRLLDRVLF